MVQGGAKKRPTVEPDPDTSPVAKRIFGMAEAGRGILDITRTLNAEGIANPTGRFWSKNGVHITLRNEVYTGALVWGTKAKDGAPPVRVEDAHPAIVSKREYQRANKLLGSRAPRRVHPRRSASPYLLSGLLRCETCAKAMTAAEAKSFENLIVDEIRANVLTESNIRDLVRLVDEELDGLAHEQRQRLETVEPELDEVRRRLDRLYNLVETTDLDMADVAPRIREHRERQERLEASAQEARVTLSQRREVLDDVETITAYPQDLSVFLNESELTERRAFIQSFVKGIVVMPGNSVVRFHPHARRQPHSGNGRRGGVSTRPGSVDRQVW